MQFEFYETKEGKEVVYQELLAIRQQKVRKLVQNKLVFYAQKQFDQFRRGRDLERIKGTDLWELKIRTSPPHRALCLLIDLSKMLILHLFSKKDDGPIKDNEIEVALHRLREYRERN